MSIIFNLGKKIGTEHTKVVRLTSVVISREILV